MSRPIIIDTDPGIDDAVALAIALFNKELDVRLITTIAGNVGIDSVTKNALQLLNFFGKKVPVAMGAAEPLVEKLVDASDVHGSSGLGGYEFEEPTKELLLEDGAVNAMYKEIMSSKEKITLVPIGPLTNIALLLKMYPEVKSNIQEIVLMGGSASRGNKGVMSEFNIATDPEAAFIVFNSDVDVVMVGLDVGWKTLIYPEDSKNIKNMNKIGDMIYHLFKTYRGGSFNTGLKMYDSCAIAYLLKPEMFEVVETYTQIELASGLTRGCTVVDLKGYLKRKPNSKVCLDINQDMFKEWFMNEISRF
ncbi:ribonucleoside hydrolase RihC [Natronincola ferrireducens]|uniref:Non-specific riboncleoside hydrolase n=1 Tax=Natronincola ferrireducens TaxID=393762 RepID=A0A1G9GHW1_9FIRM|nr:ribonucleoside hydrolase RihC [Natronincola ferrireducens]SDL00271.1 non-specific riboncleoside hydrolase [Natronincola ferrireducens]